MLATDIGDEMCWWQFEDVGDGFGHFGHQDPLLLNISVRNHQFCNQDLDSVANILKLSSTVSHRHHNVINMTVAYSRRRKHTSQTSILPFGKSLHKNARLERLKFIKNKLFFNTDIKSSHVFSKSISSFRIKLRCDHFKWDFNNVFHLFENKTTNCSRFISSD